jgi:energy-converting hydrogenase Eha subunit B
MRLYELTVTVIVTVTEIKCSSYKIFIVGLMIRVSNDHLMFIQIFSVHNSTTCQVRSEVR